MDAYRMNAKFYLSDGADISNEQWYRALNGWISTTPGEVLIDVADYSHVGRGPLTVLVGHNANYALDNTDGRMGLMYCRKRPLEDGLPNRLRSVFRSALLACRRLEEDPMLGNLQFRGDEVQVSVNDRLWAPNTEEARKTLESVLYRQLKTLFRSSNIEISHEPDTRCRLTINAKSKRELGISGLLDNVDNFQ